MNRTGFTGWAFSMELRCLRLYRGFRRIAPANAVDVVVLELALCPCKLTEQRCGKLPGLQHFEFVVLNRTREDEHKRRDTETPHRLRESGDGIFNRKTLLLHRELLECFEAVAFHEVDRTR